MDRIARWEKAGRVVILRCNRRRMISRADYLRLLTEDSTRSARSPAPAQVDDAASDVAKTRTRRAAR